MHLKFFSLSNLTLFVALALSSVAAYYSIIGLTAIFAGAVIPVIVMGCMLEVAKLTVTVWLRKYWTQCSLMMKAYLVPAVIVLAMITSLGIFGLLSKSHLDQGVGTDDVAAKVALIDEKVKTHRDNIKSSRDALAQMDMQVNQVIVKGDTEKSAERSVQIRRQQAKERAAIQKEIEVANASIAKLNEERAPIASQLRKAESDVGPIKYVAAVIYGDNPDANLLEKAVRWVIMLLVAVFDPLAIAMLLAANQSREWDKVAIGPKPDDPLTEVAIGPKPDDPLTEVAIGPKPDDPLTEVAIGPKPDDPLTEVAIGPKPDDPLAEPEFVPEILPASNTPSNELEFSGNYITYEGRKMHRDALRALHPELFLTTNVARPVNTNFGTSFPADVKIGDIFVRVDMLPNKVFKFSGDSWIEVNKKTSTAYLEPEYLKHLVSKIESGEYDVELLSDSEKAQIEEYLSDLKSV